MAALPKQLTSRLNGRIYLPNVTKYRALEDDLIPQTSQDTLLASSTLDRLKQPAELLLQEKQHLGWKVHSKTLLSILMRETIEM